MTLLWFILGLSLLIFIHELGHFTFAKIFNVYVYEFSLFMGPKIFQIKGKETKYTLRCLPIGGYCSMAGEQDAQGQRNEKELSEDNQVISEPQIEIPAERTINGVAWWKKFIILFAGAGFNIILCFLLLVTYYAGVGKVDPSSTIKVVSDSIFETSGVQSGDKIIAMTGSLDDGTTYTLEEIDNYAQISDLLSKTNPSVEAINPLGMTQCLSFTVMRDGQEINFDNICRTFTKYTVVDNQGTLTVNEIEPLFGFGQQTTKASFQEVISGAATTEVEMAGLIYRALGGMFQKGGLSNVSGVVGMYESAVVFANQGFFAFLFYLAMISVNLGIINLLPFPALDGGRLLFMIIEKISGRKISPKVENIVNGAGFVILITFILFITIKDIFF